MSATENSTLLLVTGDTDRADYLSDQFAADGFEVVVADDAAMGVRALERTYPDLVVVEGGLPEGSGLAVVSAVRSSDGVTSRVDPDTPMIVLCAGADALSRVRALDRGADDVVSLPADYPELLARARALLRRAGGRRRHGAIRVGPISLDPVTRTVAVGDQPLELSQKEFALLQVLAGEPTRVFSKDELLRTIWGFRSERRTRTLDSHACRLRQKLAIGEGRFVINVWGVGYKLVDGAVVAEPHAVRRPTPLRAVVAADADRLAA